MNTYTYVFYTTIFFKAFMENLTIYNKYLSCLEEYVSLLYFVIISVIFPYFTLLYSIGFLVVLFMPCYWRTYTFLHRYFCTTFSIILRVRE